jgi:hypothetical protein
MLKLTSLYKDNDDRVYSYVYLNRATNLYEVHCYENDLCFRKEFSELTEAVLAADEWVQ